MLSGHCSNDVNPHLINFYLWLPAGPGGAPASGQRQELYYAYRARFNELIADPETAASQEAAELFYYLNRTGYNGLCRFNKQGAFNVPFGRYKADQLRPGLFDYQACY